MKAKAKLMHSRPEFGGGIAKRRANRPELAILLGVLVQACTAFYRVTHKDRTTGA